MTGWEPSVSTGLIDDADITITKAEFNYDAEYASGEQLIMIFHGTSTHPDHPEFRQFYSIGKGWETNDRGATVEGSLEGFNEQTQYWKFIEAALAVGAGDTLQSRGTPDQAAIWEGLKFHVKRKEVDYGGSIGKKQVLVPTAFLGVEGEAGKAETPATEAQAAPVGEPAAAPAASNGKDPVLEAKLIALAKGSKDHNEFIEKALENHQAEVQGDMEVYADVVDPAGLYARANA